MKITNFGYVTGKSIKEHNTNLLQIPNHPNKILIINWSGPGKTSSLLNLIKHRPNFVKIHSYAKVVYEAKYQMLIIKCEIVSSKRYNDPKVFIEYSVNMDGLYGNIDK